MNLYLSLISNHHIGINRKKKRKKDYENRQLNSRPRNRPCNRSLVSLRRAPRQTDIATEPLNRMWSRHPDLTGKVKAVRPRRTPPHLVKRFWILENHFGYTYYLSKDYINETKPQTTYSNQRHIGNTDKSKCHP